MRDDASVRKRHRLLVLRFAQSSEEDSYMDRVDAAPASSAFSFTRARFCTLDCARMRARLPSRDRACAPATAASFATELAILSASCSTLLSRSRNSDSGSNAFGMFGAIMGIDIGLIADGVGLLLAKLDNQR